MKTFTEIFRAKSSGQLLIVAALATAILVASTTVYVYELVGERQSTDDYSLSDFVLALKLGSKNAIIGALVNTSNSGEKTVLAKNLETLSSVSTSFYKYGLWRLSYTLLNGSGYEDGVRLSWNTSGFGVSSAYAVFSLRVFGLTSNFTVNYAINITTLLTLDGYYTGSGAEKTVNLTCRVFNEGKPAQIKNATLHYENLGVWLPVGESNNLSITDWGNGTYTISFTAAIASDPVQVSAHVHDFRNLFVMANTTCSRA
ncbi:MAG: hypothetical protein ACUVTE_02335 [Candidatus Bathycorpusculaceae bacterium]